jgi:hypothetical protein
MVDSREQLVAIPHFEGNVDTRWLTNADSDRRMRLLSDFAFVDSSAFKWVAPAGDIVDGASIPEQVWTQLIGTPFIGDYRRASVVHDVACARQIKNSREAHRMFYEAMLADGTSKPRALLFYTAVRLFGPKWDENGARATPLADPGLDIDFDALESALDAVAGDQLG